MMRHYYIVRHDGESCGHRHSEITGGTLVRCAAAARKLAPAGWRVDLWEVDEAGNHNRAPREAREALANALPSRGSGRRAGLAPRIEQASPLYARLSKAERERYEKVAAEAGVPDLGKFALVLLERAALEGQRTGLGGS